MRTSYGPGEGIGSLTEWRPSMPEARVRRYTVCVVIMKDMRDDDGC